MRIFTGDGRPWHTETMTGHPDFQKILARVAAGENVEQIEFVHFLMDQSTADRQAANFALGKAFAKAGNMQAAAVLARRAFDLDKLNADVFNFCYATLQSLNRLEDLVDITREAIVMAATEGDPHLVYELYIAFTNILGGWPLLKPIKPDRPSDRIVAWIMERTFGSPGPKLDPSVLNGRRIKVGIMLAGDSAQESALVRAAIGFARYHDRNRFEVTIYSYLTPAEARQANPRYDAWLADFKSWGCAFRAGVPAAGLAKVIATHKAILLDQLDVLVFNMLIADYYVLALLKSAPVLVAGMHGNPRGYTMRHLDGALATDPHSHMESLTRTYWLTPAVDFDAMMPNDAEVKPATRAAFDIPDGATVIMTAGAEYKHANPAFWHAAESILRACPNAVWMICGVEKPYLKRAGITISSDVDARFRFVPWRQDFVWNVLPLAEIVVDTFPAGGAFVIFWAMRRGLPCVSFRSNYLRPFHSLDWSPAFRVVESEEMALPYGDTDALVRRVTQLVGAPDERAQFGAACKEMSKKLDRFDAYARDMGDALIDMIKRKQSAAA